MFYLFSLPNVSMFIFTVKFMAVDAILKLFMKNKFT